MLDRKIHAKNILRQILVGKKANEKKVRLEIDLRR